MGAKQISFGPFWLDGQNECLWHGSQAISLRPKPFAVLKLLLAHAGQLVSKQQLLDSVWPGTFVGDAVLKDSIRQLREALNDDAGSPTYIETAHRRGYRFIAKVEERPSPKDATDTTQVIPQVASDQVLTTSSPGSVLGREAELARLQAWWELALAGQRQVVFVTGEAGIGKTTLAEAFLKTAAAIPGVCVARGQCLEHYGAGEPFLPVLEGFSRLARQPSGSAILDLLRQHAPTWLAQMPGLVSPKEREALQQQLMHVTRERMLREMAEASRSSLGGSSPSPVSGGLALERLLDPGSDFVPGASSRSRPADGGCYLPPSRGHSGRAPAERRQTGAPGPQALP